MQNSSNTILDSLVDFLRTNNIKLDDILDKFLNMQNNSSKQEEVTTSDINNNFNGNSESEKDYQLLVIKLKNINNIIKQLSLDISGK
tara:strand:- start:16864 stop:17124 length:261 start_codon:yes stop_codon:yes gene_type:complete